MNAETNSNAKLITNGKPKGMPALAPKSCPADLNPILEIQTYEVPPGTEKQHLVNLEDLEYYVKSMIQSGGFKDQYHMLKIGQQKPWDVGRKVENKHKNRYADLLPYDENRVVLQQIKNEPHSDYINASFVDGYNRKRAYICTQGPSEKTIPDFWRMIWQEEVSIFSMTANIIENGKKKCEKYWPDSSAKYGDISVTLQKEEIFLDYLIRNFKLQKGSASTVRYVRQYQFTAWPDHGVPSYPMSLVNMLQDIKIYQGNVKTPVVWHCSAGIGRSGTVMLLEMALEMSLCEKKLDILGILYRLRQQRVNLVETVEQFIFVHQTLIEYHFNDITKKPSAELVLYFNKLRQMNHETKKCGLDLQFEKLKNLDPPKFQEKCISGKTMSNKSKNRNPDILPPDDGRPILKTNPPTNYINAVYVHGYGKQNNYISTQFPLPETLNDFWQLLYDSGSTTIAVLNEPRNKDETCPIFWPKSGSSYYGYFKVELTASEPEYFNGVLTRKLKIRNTKMSAKSRNVKLFQLHGWHKDDIIPPNMDSILHLLSKLNRWNNKSGQKPAIITCYDGSKASGFFCAVSYLNTQIHETQFVDVFQAVRTVRLNRPSFISTVEQYRWLYEVACLLVSNKKIIK